MGAAISNSGVFWLEDPDGITVGPVIVGTAYIGGGLSFTIADGTTDFRDGDTFEINVTGTAGNGGTFKVVGPDGNRKTDLIVGTAYAGACFAVTVAAGSADWAVGDTVTVTVTDTGTVAEADGYANALAGVLMEDSDSTSAATYPTVMVAGGILRQASVNAPSGLTVAGFKDALLDQLGIQLVAGTFIP
jgi:hypothetical protein